MFVVRPIREGDLAGLRALAASAKKAMTTLPDDEEFLKNKIMDSLRAFDPHVRKPGGESYLFVLEDTSARKIVGTCGIVSKVGGFNPFYSYRIETEVRDCDTLKVHKEIQVLHFSANYNGPTEIQSLFLSSEYRGRGLARLLSLSRFLFMAEFTSRFDKTVISELRGAMDKKGQSPFWEAVGRHFFDTDFYTVDFLSGTGRKDFIAKLMPKHPIYVPLLPRQTREVIGKVHREARPAQALLEQEGFVFNGEVDIFDAGPTVSVRRDQIRAVRDSRKAELGSIEDSIKSRDFMITNAQLDFRACIGPVKENLDGTASITQLAAEALNVKVGEALRYVVLRKGTTRRVRRKN